MAIKVNKITRVMSPLTRAVRDELEKFVKIDKFELKDSGDVVVGWSLPFSELNLQTFLDKITVNNFVWVARSSTRTEDFTYEIYTYEYKPQKILIRITTFIDYFTIEVL